MSTEMNLVSAGQAYKRLPSRHIFHARSSEFIMRFVVPLAAAVAVVASPALAQDADAKPSSAQSCKAFIAHFGMVEDTPKTSIEELGTGCRIRDFYVKSAPYMRYHIASATLSAPDLFEAFAAERLPREVEVSIESIVFAPDAGGPLSSYVIRMQSEPMDIHFAYRWDRDERTVQLSDFSVDAGNLGGFRLAGRFSEVDLDPDRFKDVSALPGALDQVTLELTNARFFTAYVAPMLLNMLPPDADPEPLIETYKQAAISFIEAVPVKDLSSDSKAALVSFVAAFPRPRGSYTLEVKADPGLALNKLSVNGAAELGASLALLQIAVTHAMSVQP